MPPTEFLSGAANNVAIGASDRSSRLACAARAGASACDPNGSPQKSTFTCHVPSYRSAVARSRPRRCRCSHVPTRTGRCEAVHPDISEVAATPCAQGRLHLPRLHPCGDDTRRARLDSQPGGQKERRNSLRRVGGVHPEDLPVVAVDVVDAPGVHEPAVLRRHRVPAAGTDGLPDEPVHILAAAA
jgi:hypothetical protein